MTAVQMYEDPILKDTIIEKGSNKIGYFCFTAFQTKSEADMLNVFSDFKNKNVTDVILDLRYNGGGYSSTAKILVSILAPYSVVKNKGIYLTEKWNSAYTQYYTSNKVDLNDYFLDTLPVNMNLNRIYILTSGNTASASESTILGLRPYMDVTLVGDTTHGKYYGGFLLSLPDYYGSSVPSSDLTGVSDWGMYLMVYQFTNKNNESYSGGIPPTVLAAEDDFDLKPMGDVSDPLLGKALELITGERFVETKSGRITPDYKLSDKQLSYQREGRLINNSSLPPRINK
jgi:C-terminal processing protease CtpA/Prc